MTARFDAIGLIVGDMSRSLAFYRRLGLDIPDSADAEPHVEVITPGGTRLLFDTEETIRSFEPEWQPPSGGGHRIGLAFACDDAAGVDAVHAALVDAGYESHREPWDAFWGQRYALVRDPDGNAVDLFAPLDGAT